MARRLAIIVLGTALALGTGSLRAQQGLPPAPIPVVPPGPPLDTAPPPRAVPGPGPLPAVPPGAPVAGAPANLPPPPLIVPPPIVPPAGPVVGAPPILVPPPPPPGAPGGPAPLPADPWAGRVHVAPPGWFGEVELDLVGPHIKNRLMADVAVTDNFTDTVHLPTASLDWTLSPLFRVGYRFANNAGEFSAAYRFLTTDGRATLPDLGGFGLAGLNSHLDFNVVDLDYGSGNLAAGPYWDIQWRLGLRLADAYFNSRAGNEFEIVQTSNSFFGVGPHGGVQAWRRLDVPGLAVYGRLEGAIPVGDIRQCFSETLVVEDGNVTGVLRQRQTQAVPMLTFELGAGWVPPWSPFTRWTAGYYLERWWGLGEIGDSHADLTVQGLFLRGEIGF